MKRLIVTTTLLLSVVWPAKSQEVLKTNENETVFLTTTDKVYVRECCYVLRVHASQINSILDTEMGKLFHRFQTQAINQGYSQEDSEIIGRLKTRLAYDEITKVSILNCEEI
ncbi:MAG: hypothetical protein AB4041_13470 [Microcystaceae cyanobacterium]